MICFFYIGFTYGKNRVISEGIDFSDDLQEASADIRSQLDKVEENIETINSMGSFSGKAAGKEAKQYFGELHLTIMESFRGLFDDLEANLEQYINTVESAENCSESTIVKTKGSEKIASTINQYVTEHTLHFRNIGGMGS